MSFLIIIIKVKGCRSRHVWTEWTFPNIFTWEVDKWSLGNGNSGMVVFVGGGGPSGECWREEGRPTGLEHHATLHLHFLVHTKTTTLAPLFSLIVSLSFRMDQEKLARMQAQVRIGGKGTARRKKKVVHRSATTDDKKLQSTLKKLAVSTIPGIEEVNMIKDDGTVIHFNNPKVQASLGSNVFAVTGHGETKEVADMLPSILSQMGPESLEHVRRFAYTGGQQRLGQMMGSLAGKTDAGEEGDNDSDDEDVPDLVSNFDEPSKDEANVAKTESSKPADAPAATGTSKKEE